MGQSHGSLPPDFEQALGRVLHFDDQLLIETCPGIEQQFDILHDIVLSLYDHSQFKHFIQTRIDALVLKHLGRILCFLVNIHKQIVVIEKEQNISVLYRKLTNLTIEIEKIVVCIYEMAIHFLSNPFLYQSLALNLLQGEKDSSQDREQVYSYYIDPGFYFISKINIIEQVLKFLKELTIGGSSRHLFLEPQSSTINGSGSDNSTIQQQDQKITDQKKQDFIGSIMEIQQQFALKSRGFELLFTILEFYVNDKIKKQKKHISKVVLAKIILMILDICKNILDNENTTIAKSFISVFGLDVDMDISKRKRFCHSLLYLCQITQPNIQIQDLSQDSELDLYFLIRMSATHLLFIIFNDSSLEGRKYIIDCVIIYGLLLNQLKNLIIQQQSSLNQSKQLLISLEFLRVCCSLNIGSSENLCTFLLSNLLPQQMVLYITNSQIAENLESVESYFSMDHYSYSLVWNQQMRDELVKVIDTELSLAEDRLDLISNEHQWISVLSICKDLKINYKNLHGEIEVNGIYIERALEYLSMNPDMSIENLLTHETFDSLYEKMLMLSESDKEDLELKNKILITLSRLNELVKALQLSAMNTSKTNESATDLVAVDLIPRKSSTPPLHKMIYLSKLLSLKHFKDEYFYNTTLLISSILSNKKKIANYVEDLDKEDALNNLMIHLAREQLVSFNYSEQGNTLYMETEGLRRILSLVYILGELLNFKPRRMLDIVNNPHFINVIVMNLSLSSNKTEKVELIWQSVFLLHTLLDSPLYNPIKLRQTIQKTGVFEYLLLIILNMEEHSTKCLTAIVNFLKSFHIIPISDRREDNYSYLRYFLPSQLLKLLGSDKERDIDLFISALTRSEYNSPFLIWNSTHRNILKNSISKRLKSFDEKRRVLSKQVAEWQQNEPTRISKVIFSSSMNSNYLFNFEEPEIISYQDLDEKLSINDIFVEAFVNLQVSETDEDASINELEHPDIFLLKLVEALQKEQKYRNIELIMESQTKLYFNFSLGKYTTPSQGHSPHFLKYQGYPSLIRKYQGLLEDMSDDVQRIKFLNLFVRLIACQLEPEPEISHRNKLLFITSGGLIFISEYIIKNNVCRNDEQLMINTLRVLDSIADILMPLVLEDEEEQLIPTHFFDIFVPLLDTKYIERNTEVSLRSIHCIRKYVRHLQLDTQEKLIDLKSFNNSARLIHNRWPLILQLIRIGFIFNLHNNTDNDHSFIKSICITALEIINNLISSKMSASFETLLEKLLSKNLIEILMQITKKSTLTIFDKIKTFDDFYNFTRLEINHLLLVWNENMRGELTDFIDENIQKNYKELISNIEKFSYSYLKCEGMFKLLDTDLDIYPTCLVQTWRESNLLSLSEFLQSNVDPSIINSTNLIQSLITSLHSLLVVEYQQKMITKETLKPLSQQVTLLKLIVCQDSSKNLSSETPEQTLIFLNTSYQQVILHIYHLLIGYLSNLTKNEEFIIDSVGDLLEIIMRISKFFSKYTNKIGEEKTKEFYQYIVAAMHKYLIYYYKGCNAENSIKEEELLITVIDYLIVFFKTVDIGNSKSAYSVDNGLLLSILYSSIQGGAHEVLTVRMKATMLLSTLIKLSIPSAFEILDKMLFPSFGLILGQGQLDEFIKQFDQDVTNPEVWWDGRDRDLVTEYLSEHVNLSFDFFFMGTHLEDYSFDKSIIQSKFNRTEKGYKLKNIYLNKLNEMPTYQFTTITNHQFIEMIIEKLSSLCAKFEESNINNTEERKTIWKTAYTFIQNHSLLNKENSQELDLQVEQSLLLLLELFCRELVYITQSEEKHDMFVISLLCFLNTFVKKYSIPFIQFLNNFSDFTTILLRVANSYRSILRSVLQIILETVAILIREKSTMSSSLYESILEQLGSELNIAYLFLFIMNKVQAPQCADVLVSISKIDENLVPYLKESWLIPEETFFTSSEMLLESLLSVNDEKWNDEKRSSLTQKSEEIVNKFEEN